MACSSSAIPSAARSSPSIPGPHRSPSAVKINVQGVDAKIAALVGVTPDQIMINDVKVNPISKNVYLSASRGRGPDAMPLIVRVDGSGKVTLLSLDNVKHASVSLTDAPASDPTARQNPRMQTITDMNYVNGNLMVAGLSNEEWSSALRSIPFPFKTAAEGATLQIWHSSHGRYETASPVRTFVPYTISGQQYILAAYTCTPLVKIPVSELKPGAKVKGVTIADLGAGNQPLDMVPYKKDGHDYILIANSSLGVMKLKADNLETYPPIDSPTVTDVAGVPYDTHQRSQERAAPGAARRFGCGDPDRQDRTGPAYAPGPPLARQPADDCVALSSDALRKLKLAGDCGHPHVGDDRNRANGLHSVRRRRIQGRRLEPRRAPARQGLGLGFRGVCRQRRCAAFARQLRRRRRLARLSSQLSDRAGRALPRRVSSAGRRRADRENFRRPAARDRLRRRASSMSIHRPTCCPAINCGSTFISPRR